MGGREPNDREIADFISTNGISDGGYAVPPNSIKEFMSDNVWVIAVALLMMLGYWLRRRHLRNRANAGYKADKSSLI